MIDALPGPDVFVEIRCTSTLSEADRTRMFTLLDAYYLNARREQFEHDLSEKQWVVMITRNGSRELCGFSTLMRFDCRTAGTRVAALYSGDTVLENDLWGRAANRAVALALRHMVAIAEADRAPTYWFMVSSTYKSYRLLPHLFRTFVPQPGTAIPPETVALLHALVQCKFGRAFDPATGTISFPNPTVPRPHAAAPPAELVGDPYVRFFLQRNPGSAQGERLVSVAELSRSNLTVLGLRFLGRAR